ncbi:MAG: FAD-dependent oxidoreductase [Dehalococcoidales bacterium]
MNPPKNNDIGNLETDLIVIGAGGSGLAAAVAAAEKGIKSIVLEKRGVPGGNSATGGGPFASESPVQKRYGIDAPTDDFFKIAMSWSHWKTNPRIVRAFIDKSGDTIRWLEEKGLKFFPLETRITYHVPEGEGAGMMKVLRKGCEDLGVRILVHTQARKILTGEDGRITGVLASTKDKEYTITTKSVIIATGGYGSNKELLKKYCSSYHDGMEYHGVPNTGDGLLMAIEIGAAVENPGTMLLEGPLVHTSVLLKINIAEKRVINVPLVALAWEPYLMWVNKSGKRFMAEDAGSPFEGGNAVSRQPDNVCFLLFDSQICQMINERGLVKGRPLPNAPLEFQRGKLPGFEKELQSQAVKGRMRIADSWDEIAEWIGTSPEALKATVDEYNIACEYGYDPIFAKDRRNLLPLRTPPYYALRCSSAFLDTIGGIKINEKMEVIDNQFKPIPGLFAAGVVTGGWEGDTYCYKLLGSARGFALNSGRIAGENATKYISK